MARNRKRAKERRARRPQPVASARAERADAPGPISHAASDVELPDDSRAAQSGEAVGRAGGWREEAQLAFGRSEPAGAPDTEAPGDEQFEPTDFGADGAEDSDGAGGYGGPPSVAGAGVVAAGGGEPGGGGAAVAQRRVGLGGRLVGFLQGSWRELQRVQWPDRRQVGQATGVVLGFVIVAGVFLGVADLLASHLMTFILNGHW